MRPTDAQLRRALEDSLPLLEATRLRYRALRNILRAWLWHGRFRRNGDLVREVIRSQPEVNQALTRALERSRAERWPKVRVTRLLEDVEGLREEVERLTAWRLGVEPGPLGTQLAALETAVVRDAYAGKALRRRRAAAREMLPVDLPALHAAADASRALEAFAKSPAGAPPTPAQALRLREALEAAQRHLDEAWERVALTDAGGTVLRFLDRRSRRLPLRPQRDGPDVLMRATFWLRTCRARLRQALASDLPGIEVPDAQLSAVVAWLWGAAPAESGWSDERIAALEVSRALAKAQAAPASAARWPPEEWERLRSAAAKASGDASAASLRTELYLGAPEAAWGNRRTSLVALVDAWRAAARTPVVKGRIAWGARARGNP
jgi:hypothetical protein